MATSFVLFLTKVKSVCLCLDPVVDMNPNVLDAVVAACQRTDSLQALSFQQLPLTFHPEMFSK